MHRIGDTQISAGTLLKLCNLGAIRYALAVDRDDKGWQAARHVRTLISEKGPQYASFLRKKILKIMHGKTQDDALRRLDTTMKTPCVDRHFVTSIILKLP